MWLNTARFSLDENVDVFLDFYMSYVDILTHVDGVSFQFVGLN